MHIPSIPVQLQYTVLMCRVVGALLYGYRTASMWLPYSSCASLIRLTCGSCTGWWGIPMGLPYSSCVAPVQLMCGFHTASRLERTSHQSEILDSLVFPKLLHKTFVRRTSYSALYAIPSWREKQRRQFWLKYKSAISRLKTPHDL